MRKFYALAAAALLTCGSFNIALAQTKKKVLYITQDKGATWDPAAASVDNDIILQMLKKDPNFEVTVKKLSSTDASTAGTAVPELETAEVIIVQESIGGGSAILTPAGTLGMAKLTKPTIYNKVFALQPGRALAAGQVGAGVDVAVNSTNTDGVHVPGFTALALTVPTANRSNPLFSGINFADAGGSVPLFKVGATDNGAAPTGTQAYKSLSYNNTVVLNPENRTLAEFVGNETKSISPTGTPVLLNDVPANTTIGSEVTKARMILMGMNFGAINRDGGTNITAQGLTIWRNAVYVLAGLTPPTTLVDPAVILSARSEVANAVFSLNQNYPNPSNGATTISFELKKAGPIALEVYDITGKKVATLVNGNKAAGSHEVKLDNNLRSGIYFYKLSTAGVSASRKMLIAK